MGDLISYITNLMESLLLSLMRKASVQLCVLEEKSDLNTRLSSFGAHAKCLGTNLRSAFTFTCSESELQFSHSLPFSQSFHNILDRRSIDLDLWPEMLFCFSFVFSCLLLIWLGGYLYGYITFQEGGRGSIKCETVW